MCGCLKTRRGGGNSIPRWVGKVNGFKIYRHVPICGISEPPFKTEMKWKLPFSLGHQFLIQSLELEAEDDLDLLNKFFQFRILLYDVVIVEFHINRKDSALTCSHFR